MLILLFLVYGFKCQQLVQCQISLPIINFFMQIVTLIKIVCSHFMCNFQLVEFAIKCKRHDTDEELYKLRRLFGVTQIVPRLVRQLRGNIGDRLDDLFLRVLLRPLFRDITVLAVAHEVQDLSGEADVVHENVYDALEHVLLKQVLIRVFFSQLFQDLLHYAVQTIYAFHGLRIQTDIRILNFY